MNIENIEQEIMMASDFSAQEVYKYIDQFELLDYVIFSSNSLGYAIKISYEYIPAYNDQGILGGYAISNISKEIIQGGEI